MTNATKWRVLEFFGVMAIIGCATAQTTAPVTDPCVEKGLDTGFLPHPNDCTKYFSCYGGKGYEIVCPDGKYFNSTETLCDIAENVDCVSNDCPPDGIVYLPIPNECERFTICIGGNAYEGTCDAGLVFDSELQECNLANETNCVINPCNPSPPEPIIEPEIYPNPGNCRQYIICLDAEPIIRDCAPTLFFDPDTKKCKVGECPVTIAVRPVMNEPEMDIW